MCFPISVCSPCASVWKEQGHCELMQRDEAKFTPWNIYQHRPGNDISLTFTLILSHKGQRGSVAAACALTHVFQRSNSSLCCLEGFSHYLSWQRRFDRTRGETLKHPVKRVYQLNLTSVAKDLSGNVSKQHASLVQHGSEEQQPTKLSSTSLVHALSTCKMHLDTDRNISIFQIQRSKQWLFVS